MELNNHVVVTLAWTLIHFLWQGMLVVLVLAWILNLIDKQNSTIRYNLCMIVLIGLFLIPLINFYQLYNTTVDTRLPNLLSIQDTVNTTLATADLETETLNANIRSDINGLYQLEFLVLLAWLTRSLSMEMGHKLV